MNFTLYYILYKIVSLSWTIGLKDGRVRLVLLSDRLAVPSGVTV